MKIQKFPTPEGLSATSGAELLKHYKDIFFAYRDLAEAYNELSERYSDKGGALRLKREIVQTARSQRSRGGSARHNLTRASSLFYIRHYWHLSTEQQFSRRVSCGLVMRELTTWVSDPNPKYGIDLGNGPPIDLAQGTCQKLHTACNKAFELCNGDQREFERLVFTLRA